MMNRFLVLSPDSCGPSRSKSSQALDSLDTGDAARADGANHRLGGHGARSMRCLAGLPRCAAEMGSQWRWKRWVTHGNTVTEKDEPTLRHMVIDHILYYVYIYIHFIFLMIHEIMTYYDYQFANELICRYFSRLWEKKQCTASSAPPRSKQ